jgi:cyclophilin family peptidyl-prolyl cis-trans isomerase
VLLFQLCIIQLHYRNCQSKKAQGFDRVVLLFENGFFDNTHFFRVVPKFLVQFGITYNEELKPLGNSPIPDDPQLDPRIPFAEGIISFAGSGDNSRSSQIFISYGASESLGEAKWETPLGKVVEGMENVRNFYSYGDMPPWGKGPVQGKIHSGPHYIEDNFPLTDRFHNCSVDRKKPGSAVKQQADKGEAHFVARSNTAEEKRPTFRVLEQKAQEWIQRQPNNQDYAFLALGLAVLALLAFFVWGLRQRKRGTTFKSS